MNPNKLFPLVITDKLSETKAYYTDKAEFEVVTDMPEYLQVRYGGEDGPELCFMTPNAAPAAGNLPTFNGKGLIISIPTESADKKHAALAKRGAELISDPEDKPWGWRSFAAVDPNGVLLDFFHVKADSAANAAS